MSRIIVPRAPGHFCAFGMLHSDLRYDFVRTWFTRLEDAPFAEIERIYQRADRPRARRRSPTAACDFSSTTVTYAADMRYVGQEHPVTVDLSPAVFRKRDRDAHQAPLRRGAPAALWHQRPRGARRDRQPARHGDRPDEETAAGTDIPRTAQPPRLRRKRHAHWFSSLDKKLKTPAYARDGLKAGNRIAGPGTDRRARVDHGAAAGRPSARSTASAIC